MTCALPQVPQPRRRLPPHPPALLVVLLLVASAARAAPERVTYALIIANNASLDRKQSPLRYADDDGARYYELFAPRVKEAVLLSVLDEETQSLHPGLAPLTRPPTRAELTRALEQLNSRMAADRARGALPVLYFIFTGHGKRGPAGEGTVNLLDGLLTRTELFEQILAPSRAAFLHLIVDACDSYYFVNSRGHPPRGPAQAQAVARHLEARELANYPHVGAVLSTSSEQESHEWSAIRSGIFSHLVRSALAGAADVNKDGRVEYSELQAFVAAANLKVRDVRGQVALSVHPPAQDRSAPLVDLSESAPLGFLVLPQSLVGRLWVENARNVRVVELHKERGQSLVLALPLERSYFLRTDRREAHFSLPRPRGVVDAGGLSWRPSELAARGAVEQALHEGLFSVPFGPRFYNGYMASMGEQPVAFERELEP